VILNETSGLPDFRTSGLRFEDGAPLDKRSERIRLCSSAQKVIKAVGVLYL